MPLVKLELGTELIERYTAIAKRLGTTAEHLMQAVLYTEVAKIVNREIAAEEQAAKKAKNIILTGIRKGLKEDAVEGKKRVRK